MAIVDKALNPVDYQILRIVEDGKKNKEKVDTLIEIFRIIKNIEYETEQNKFLKKAGTILGIPENTVITDYNRFLQKENKAIKEVDSIKLKSGMQDFLVKSYQEMIILLCNFPELIDQAKMDLSIAEFPDTVSKNIFIKLTELYSNNEDISIDKIFDYFTEGDEKSLLEKSYCNIEDPESAYNDYNKRYLRIKKELIDRKIDYYYQLINKSGSISNKDLNEYLVEYQILQRERDNIEPYL